MFIPSCHADRRADHIRLFAEDFQGMYTSYAEDSGQIWPGTPAGATTYDSETFNCGRGSGEAFANLHPLTMLTYSQALQETVACMCAVVQNLTHDFVRLVALAKSCNGMNIAIAN